MVAFAKARKPPQSCRLPKRPVLRMSSSRQRNTTVVEGAEALLCCAAAKHLLSLKVYHHTTIPSYHTLSNFHRNMKWSGLLSFLWTVHVTTAAPAIVWQKASGAASLPEHTSQDTPETALFRTVQDSSLQVVFVVGRQIDGSETLSSWTAAGSLPGVAQVAPEALAMHHSVSVQSLASMAKSALTVDESAIHVTLDELKYKVEHLRKPQEIQIDADGQTVSKKMQSLQKRARALEQAKTLIVDVPANTDPAVLDEAVVDSIEREFTVVLTAVRSVQEVKMERSRQAQERLNRMKKVSPSLLTNSRRRLEDAQENQQQQNNRQDQQGYGSIYYVSMTPNIMAGLLFFFLFTFIGLVGFSCMGMIAGQDVYVKKMPSIGREA